TARADDPELTCRLPGLADRSPVRIVADRLMVLPNTANLLRGEFPPTWIITGPDAELPSFPPGIPPDLKVVAEKMRATVKPVTVDTIKVSLGEDGRLSLPDIL